MDWLLSLLKPTPAKPKTTRVEGVRLLPPVMVTVAVLLGLKALGVAEGVAANAQENAEHAPAPAAAPAQTSTPTTPAAGPQCTPSIAAMAGLSQSEVEVLQALQARRQSLDQRATQMETQDDLMTAASQRLDQRIAELHRLQDTVNGLLGQLDAAQETRINGLVDVYTRMRAKDAATVFDGLDDNTLVQVAGRMRNQNLAEVMGKMNPERARHLTQMLADRARPPTSGAALLSQVNGAAPAAPATAAAGQP
jgi:flagellar motility protein MotE (MotC chaperone)